MSSRAKSRRRRLPAIAGVAIAFITVALGASIAVAGAIGKSPFNPWAGLSDLQKQAVVDQTHAQNVQYLQEFEASHGDPRSLPVIKIPTYSPGAVSLGAGVEQATVIVHGRVDVVHFTADPNGNVPFMTATVRITDVGKGAVGSTIVVRQTGGPVAQLGGTGALVELEGEQLMLPGDEVILLLASVPTTQDYRPIYGAGVQFVQNGNLAGDASTRYGVNGKAYAEIWKSLTDPRLTSGAFPLQTSD